MSRKSLLAVTALAAIAGSVALAQQPGKDAKQPPAKPAAQPDHALPAGMTEADMKACMDAGTPGPMHQHLAKQIGVWKGKTSMWMGPGTEPMKSECTSTVSALMDGRYTKCEMAGDMPGMGPFNGFGIQGFDNVSKKFQSTWIDNMGTGIMFGTGELSSDSKTMSWNFTYNCPIAKKAVVMRQVEKYTGPNSMSMEMFGPEPHTGKEYKMMEITFTREPAGKTTGDASGTVR